MNGALIAIPKTMKFWTIKRTLKSVVFLCGGSANVPAVAVCLKSTALTTLTPTTVTHRNVRSKKMTKRTALIIACNLMSDELDAMESDYGVEEAKEDPYYAQVEEAIKILKKMMDEEG